MGKKYKYTEEELLALLREQTQHAFNVLYENYSGTLYGIVCRIVNSDESAQDVLQDAFVKIWKNFPAYDKSKGTLFTWMLNIARNTAIDFTRSKHVKNKIHNEDLLVSIGDIEGAEKSFDHIGIKEAIVNLKPEHRVIIDILFFKGYTQEEASKELSLPLGTLKTRARAAMSHLRELLTDSDIGH